MPGSNDRVDWRESIMKPKAYEMKRWRVVVGILGLAVATMCGGLLYKFTFTFLPSTEPMAVDGIIVLMFGGMGLLGTGMVISSIWPYAWSEEHSNQD